ncbi:Tetratricopeptide TPR_2 repeat protein [Pedosphaera parvula Ellin514]|uniref:Tetratricopeptide TPR_2 repeat protein n=2 Tax=Pedosphaera TaxID=1032526 RepID=B9XAE6_PEDPL|nr:Tetratricopeptide TPR_2 repeat protein [Pedosphaera parvula Ellin514]
MGNDFGTPFGELVMVAHLGFGNGSRFVGGDDGAIDFPGQADAANSAGINYAGAAGFSSRLDDVSSALDVGGIHEGIVLKPEMVAGGDMKTPIAAAHGGGVGGRIRDIAGDAFEINALEAAEVGIGTQQCLDTMAVSDQFVDKVGANKTRGAGDKTIHIERLITKGRAEKPLAEGIKRSSERRGNKNMVAEAIWHEKSGVKLDLEIAVENNPKRRMPEKNLVKKKMTREEEKELDVKISFMEGVVRRDPGYVEALQILGDDYTRRGKFVAGLRVDEQLAQLRPSDALIHYNLACSYTLTGNYNQAVAALERALNLGYRDFKWLSQDPDLSELRQHPLYKNIRATVRKLKGQQK